MRPPRSRRCSRPNQPDATESHQTGVLPNFNLRRARHFDFFLIVPATDPTDRALLLLFFLQVLPLDRLDRHCEDLLLLNVVIF